MAEPIHRPGKNEGASSERVTLIPFLKPFYLKNSVFLLVSMVNLIEEYFTTSLMT